MFERFTHAARETVIRAQSEARELRQSPIGTGHVLLALLADPQGAVATAPSLRERGVDAEVVRAALRGDAPAAGEEPATDTDAEDRAALKAIGIDLDAVRRAVEENFGPGSLRLPPSTTPDRRGMMQRLFGQGHVPFSPRNKKVLELSLREAVNLGHRFIAPEHIVLGILREGTGRGARILADRGVDPARLREDMTRSLSTAAA